MQLFEPLDLTKFANYSKTANVYVTGLSSHLQKAFVDFLKQKLSFDFVFAKHNNSDIKKYFDTLSILDAGANSMTPNALEYTVEDFGFEHASRVTGRGQWSRKGDLFTFWPIGYEHPVRISYFDKDIEYIELFDEVYNTKIDTLPNVVYGDLNRLADKVDWYEIDLSGLQNLNATFRIIFSQFDIEKNDLSIDLDFGYPTLFYKRFDLLAQEISRLQDLDWRICIQTQHIDEIPNGLQIFVEKDYEMLAKSLGLGEEYVTNLPAGFVSNSKKVLFLTDRELFGTIFLSKDRKQVTTRQARKILERLEGEIEIGDFVVHEDHGIGVYKGLHQEKTIDKKIVNFEHVEIERVSEYMLVQYAEGDELLVPLSQIQKITKYIGTTNEEPQITRLHKGTWSSTVQKAKKAIELVARDLVEHYAKINLARVQGLEVDDSELYTQFESEFVYEETPDQIAAIADIKKDLGTTKPMDRLIVGDVGFGKTEVAMRAAFRVVESGKQVVVLCPTTVLAAQHFKVFRDRFANFGISVNYVSRFNSTAQNKKILEIAKDGKIDIVVGTHRLLSNDVEFKNLGLVIIDEEQKFGVKQKEKIRKLQYGAHSLSMSATPIPRTLSMAMSEIKDISIIATPPKVRRAVKTQVAKLDWNDITNEIMTEIKRGGQAYFVHNKIETIETIKLKLQSLMPDIKFVVGHGQMPPSRLDTVITDFYEKKYDVLICTTIIENGIDMPEVNTIIINDGQNFGLGQLYQLRGRVGRSDKQAYCYIYYKGDDLQKKEESREKKKVNKKYIERLKAILESQELGSGFKLASRDLEIRGAGNLLGKQQHGNIANVGLGLYMQMLAEEIERLKFVENQVSTKHAN